MLQINPSEVRHELMNGNVAGMYNPIPVFHMRIPRWFTAVYDHTLEPHKWIIYMCTEKGGVNKVWKTFSTCDELIAYMEEYEATSVGDWEWDSPTYSDEPPASDLDYNA